MKRLIAVLLVLAFPAALSAQIGDSGTEAAPAFAADPPAPTAAPPAREAAPGSAPASSSPADQLHVLDAAPTPMGATGLMRTYQASGLRTGTFGLLLQFEYFSGTDVVRSGDEARRFLGHIGLSWTPIEYLEAWAVLSARAATNSVGDPELIQSVGDLNFGAKGFYEINEWFSAGGLLNLTMPAGANQVGLDLSAIGVDIIGITTFDFRSVADVPLRLHANLGYRVDNSANLFPFLLDRVERFGQGVYDYDRVFLGFSADAPLKYITPFLEWTLEWPNGASCEAAIEQQCVGEIGFSSYPSYLTLGARSEPVSGLSFNFGVDLGMTTAESQGTPAIPAWNLLFGAAYNLDPKGAEIVEVPVEVPIEVGSVMSHVEGVVRETGSQAPIEGARISYLETDFTDQITGADGRFRTFDFEPGSEVTIEVSHPEYETRAMRVSITAEVLSGPIDMVPSFSGALVQGTVNVSGPAEVTVSFRGDENYDVTADENGEYEIEIEPGEYRVVVSAPGYTSVRERIEFEAGRHTRGWSLGALPPGPTIRFNADGFEFADAEARSSFNADGTITPEGQALLDDVVATLETEGTGRVLVRSHTDPKDTIEEELDLTAARAQAVIDYLVSQGVPASRLEADGVGAAEPLFPNIADRNRRRNNRIEFQFMR